MALTEDKIRFYGDALFQALQTRTTLKPLTSQDNLTVDDAYAISKHMIACRVEAGERIIGKKIGVTSAPVQDMLNVRTPDFGFLTDAMHYEQGQEMPISSNLIQPRAEGELAFRLAKDLTGPGITAEDVLAATDSVMPCFEVVDSRIDNWQIKYEDTVADNASSGLYIVGEPVSPRGIDLATAEMVVEKNGQFLSRGSGVEALTGEPKLGTPVNCVAWLANTLGHYGIELQAGDVILSGSLVPLEPVVSGDHMQVTIAGVGTLGVQFV
ncbi:2-hydroxypent-2,4-dienoate hydratase-like [Ylistrum balloti]|uniref:2-hydroxypent-2,4-dienoate hydratase-like n=1 Tax=Ylistrum balloti TaxID=509963 RepID=UPI002905E430|nr:2-hydroxypent-2,4-dienoate hydratase-like [Ylistrum balloti]